MYKYDQNIAVRPVDTVLQFGLWNYR